MNIQGIGRSRDAAVREYLTALTSQKISRARLTQIAMSLAPVLPQLESTPACVSEGLRESLLTPRSNARTDAEWGIRRAIQFLFDACAQGEAEAIEAALSDLANIPQSSPEIESLADFLNIVSIARALGPAELRRIGSHLSTLPAHRFDLQRAALSLAGLSLEAPPKARQDAFDFLACPMLEDAASSNDVQRLLQLEAIVYEYYLKSTETPTHHQRTLAAIEHATGLLGKASRRDKPHKEKVETPPRIAFVIHNSALLAHSEVLLTFLRGLRKIDEPCIEPVVLILFNAAQTENGGSLGSELDRIGVKWYCPDPSAEIQYERLFDKCREWLRNCRVDAAVFVSLPIHVAYFMHAPLAPVQIWWSMKFALPNFPALDGRVFFRGLFPRATEIEGRVWHCGPIAVSPPLPPQPSAVEAVRARFGSHRQVIGTIAREEKIANVGYLDAICRILKRHPESCFVWTGRRQLQAIEDHFARSGVAERCHFVGWVDPALYIHAFDLFVETYPLSGLMATWSMAMGKPVVSVGRQGILGTYLESIFDGSMSIEPHEKALVESIFAPIRARLPALWAADPEGIDAIANLLLDDPELATSVGRAQQRFVRTFLSDEQGSAKNQARTFADLALKSRTSADRDCGT